MKARLLFRRAAWLSTLAAVFAVLGCSADPVQPATGWELVPSFATDFTLYKDRVPAADLALGLWGPNWAFFGIDGPRAVADDGTQTLDKTAKISGTGNDLQVHMTARHPAANMLTVQYLLTAPQGGDITLFICGITPHGVFDGGKAVLTLDDGTQKEYSLPLARGDLADKPCKHISFRDSLGETMEVDIAPARKIVSDVGQARLVLADGKMPVNTPIGTTFTYTFPASVKAYAHEAESYQQDDTSTWFRYPVGRGGTPVDLSFLNKDARGRFVPAGAHGFVTVKGDQFAFQDGTPARFWGVNITYGAVFGTPERAAQIADRLARLGVNVVRLHHLDDGDHYLVDYQHPDGTTQHLDPVGVRQLDRTVAELEKRGIYVVFDTWVGRWFRENDGVAAWDKLEKGNFGLHPYIYFDPRMRELLKLYFKQIWSHVNEYTGKAYKDDPGILATETINEGLMQAGSNSVRLEPYRTEFINLYHKWCAQHGVTPGPGDFPISNNYDLNNQKFFVDVCRDYYTDIHAYLRSIGVRVPINATSWFHWPWEIQPQTSMDFMDMHWYWGGDGIGAGSGLGGLWVAYPPNVPGTPFGSMASMAIAGKPVSVSEYGNNPPKTYRSAYYPGMAAIACLQGWAWMTGFAYTQSGYPREAFGSWGEYEWEADPATIASMAAGALIYRRGDVHRARQLAVMTFPETEKWAFHWEDGGVKAFQNTAEFNAAVETHKLALVLDPKVPAGLKPVEVMTPASSYAYKPASTQLRSDTGEIWRDWRIGVGTIDTPRTQAAYGFLGRSGRPWKTKDCTFRVSTPYATAVLSSLSSAPIAASKSLLLTTVARAENRGMQYNLPRTAITIGGTAPFLAEPVEGMVTFATAAPKLVAYPISFSGRRGNAIPLRISNGRAALVFKGACRTLFYEIEAPQATPAATTAPARARPVVWSADSVADFSPGDTAGGENPHRGWRYLAVAKGAPNSAATLMTKQNRWGKMTWGSDDYAANIWGGSRLSSGSTAKALRDSLLAYAYGRKADLVHVKLHTRCDLSQSAGDVLLTVWLNDRLVRTFTYSTADPEYDPEKPIVDETHEFDLPLKKGDVVYFRDSSSDNRGNDVLVDAALSGSQAQ